METVLVVEDSRPMQRTLQRLFEADGLNVQIASDGVVGLESFRKQTPNVVVLDLKLPRMPGKEVCRAFKAHASSVPVVILSANSEVEDKVLSSNLGLMIMSPSPLAPRSCWRGSGARCDAAANSLNRASEAPLRHPMKSCCLITSGSISRVWWRTAARNC